jgi:hypothetical protein
MGCQEHQKENKMITYLWIFISGFAFMTFMFFWAERDNKRMRREMMEREENSKFDSVYRQIEIESQEMARRIDVINDGTDRLLSRIHEMERKIENALKTKR